MAVPAHGQQRGPDSYTELCAIASFRDNKIFKSILLVLIEAFRFSFSKSSNTNGSNIETVLLKTIRGRETYLETVLFTTGK